MKVMIFVLVLIVAGVVGLSFYMGWFQVSSSRDGDKSSVTLSVDNGKIQEDKDTAVKEVQDLAAPETEEPAATTEKSQD